MSKDYDNMDEVVKALKYSGAFGKFCEKFNILDCEWQWHDEEYPRDLGSGEGYSPDDTFNPRCIELLFVNSHPDGPYSSFNPKYQDFNFSNNTGALSIKGKSQKGRSYTCYLTFEKN